MHRELTRRLLAVPPSLVPAAAGLLVALGFASFARAQSLHPAAFVPNNAGDSITSYTLNLDGTLNRVGVFAAGDGPQTLSLSPDGQILAVGHGTASTTLEELRFYRVNGDATLTPLLSTTTPDSPLEVLWLNDDVLAVTRTALGPSDVFAYAFNRASNTITTRDMIGTGTFTASLTATAGTLYADAGTTSNGSVSSWSFDPTGDLTFVQNQPVPGGGITVDLQPTPAGTFLYAAGGIGGNGQQLHGFRIEASGALTPLAGTPFTLNGESPAELAFSDDGLTLYVGFNGNSAGEGIIRAYDIDPATGAVTDSGNVIVLGGGVGDRGDTGTMGVLGDILFNLDMNTFRDGVRGLQTIRIGPDGSMTSIGVFDTGSPLGNVSDLVVWRGVPEPSSLAILASAAAVGLLRRRPNAPSDELEERRR